MAVARMAGSTATYRSAFSAEKGRDPTWKRNAPHSATIVSRDIALAFHEISFAIQVEIRAGESPQKASNTPLPKLGERTIASPRLGSATMSLERS